MRSSIFNCDVKLTAAHCQNKRSFLLPVFPDNIFGFRSSQLISVLGKWHIVLQLVLYQRYLNVLIVLFWSSLQKSSHKRKMFSVYIYACWFRSEFSWFFFFRRRARFAIKWYYFWYKLAGLISLFSFALFYYFFSRDSVYYIALTYSYTYFSVFFDLIFGASLDCPFFPE